MRTAKRWAEGSWGQGDSLDLAGDGGCIIRYLKNGYMGPGSHCSSSSWPLEQNRGAGGHL